MCFNLGNMGGSMFNRFQSCRTEKTIRRIGSYRMFKTIVCRISENELQTENGPG